MSKVTSKSSIQFPGLLLMHSCLPLVAMTPKFVFGVSSMLKRRYSQITASRRRKNYKAVELLITMKKKRKIIEGSLRNQSQKMMKKKRKEVLELQTVYNVDRNNRCIATMIQTHHPRKTTMKMRKTVQILE